MEKALTRIIDYAVRVVDPDRIILFGSWASGMNNVYSDVDLLIIDPATYRRSELEMQISSYAREAALAADVLIRTPREIEVAARNPSSFLASITRAGKVVYVKRQPRETLAP
jgi:predicted nucleotidyltransferase